MPQQLVRLLSLALLFALLGPARAQQVTWEDFTQTLLDDEQAEQADWAEYMDELSQLHARPLNINTATAEELAQLPMLSEEQIEEILTYVFLNGGMRSLAELMALRSIDAQTRRLLSLFLYAEVPAATRQDTLRLGHFIKHSSHELTTRVDLPLYYRRGYATSLSKGGYAGRPIAHRLAYRMQDEKHLDLSLKMEKDGGEALRYNGGYDFYSGYVRLTNIHRLKTLVVGDYRLGFGMGLVANKGYSFGKTFSQNARGGIKGHTGMDEVSYLRGVGATWEWQRWGLSAWASHRQLDATLDSSGNVRTLLSSGLHRTRSELQRRHNVSATMAGGHLQYVPSSHLRLGTTAYWQRFSRPLDAGTQLYRAFYPKGQSFFVAGADYALRLTGLSFQGEVAYSANRQGWATLHTATWQATTDTRLLLSGRYYSHDYHSFHASALSDGGAIQNESGLMLRLETRLWSRLNVSAYADLFHAPWPRYGMTHSTTGGELYLQGQLALSKRHSLTARYQFKSKESYDVRQRHHRLRLQWTAEPSARWRLRSLATTHLVEGQWGVAISEAIRHQSRDKRWTGQLMLGWYHTTDYSARVSISEPTLSGRFGSSTLSGQGLRLAVTAALRLWADRLRLEVAYGLLRVLDKNTQSSGMQEILSPWKNDLSMQLRLRL